MTRVDADKVIITTGTFLRGEIHIGMEAKPAGRIGESPQSALSISLEKAEFKLGRLRTGTPPRLFTKTIDISKLTPHHGEDIPSPFSYINDKVSLADQQVPCYKTETTEATHKIVSDNLHQTIHIKESAQGPRYCPSLESKVIKFPSKQSHTVWLEPEGNMRDTIVLFMLKHLHIRPRFSADVS